MTRVSYNERKKPPPTPRVSNSSHMTVVGGEVANLVADTAQAALSATVDTASATTLASLEACQSVIEGLTNELSQIPTVSLAGDVAAVVTTGSLATLNALLIPEPVTLACTISSFIGSIGQLGVNLVVKSTLDAQKASIEQSLSANNILATELSQQLNSQHVGLRVVDAAPVALLAVCFGVAACGIIAGKNSLFYIENKNITGKLTRLKEKRKSLCAELQQCKGEISQKKLRLEEVRKKINRLEASLVNPNQVGNCMRLFCISLFFFR